MSGILYILFEDLPPTGIHVESKNLEFDQIRDIALKCSELLAMASKLDINTVRIEYAIDNTVYDIDIESFYNKVLAALYRDRKLEMWVLHFSNFLYNKFKLRHCGK